MAKFKVTNKNIGFVVETSHLFVESLEEVSKEIEEVYITHFTKSTSVIDLLEMISHLSLKDQVHILSNLLTFSGYTQKEISQAMQIDHSFYRKQIFNIRKNLKEQRRKSPVN